MQPSEPTYDIHEKIAQLETELLQHELLIRRQKHVINSLKTMITADHVQSPPRATANSSTSTGNRNTSSSSTSAPRVSAARNNTLNGGTKTPVAPSAGVAFAAAAPTKKTPIAAVVRPVNHQKKKTAMAKVAQFCRTIPKFGDEVPPKRRRSTGSAGGDGEPAASNKRQRAQDDAVAPPPQPLQRQTAAPTPTAATISHSQRASSASRHSHHTVRDSDEDENDQADEEAFLASASAKLNYLNAIRSSTSNISNNNTSTSSQNGNSFVRPPRPAMVAVQLPAPVSSSSQASRVVSSGGSASSGIGSGSNAVKSTTTSSSQGALNNVNSTVKTSTDTSARPVTTTASSKANRPVSTVSSSTTPASITATTITTSTSSTSAISHAHILTTPVQKSSSQDTSFASPITSPRNLLTGSTYKNLEVFEYCKNLSSPEEKLEAAKDIHSYVHNNPRRLQQFLDSIGGRDLFLSWLTECMQRMEGGELTPDEELTCTKLMEYTVQLINNAFWNDKSVSELKFDKTLKNLYRLFENRREAHHVTVATIVKGIWPSYRTMRKNHETSKSKNVNVFVVD